jgi:hypothetical protein
MGAYPALWAAGAQVAARWRLRWPLLGVTAVTSVFLLLPVYPVRVFHATPGAAVSYDAREMIGWPRLVRTVAQAYRPGEVILAGDYGVAGAIARFGGAYGLPRAYSGHNGLWYLGGPPDTDAPVLVIRASREDLSQYWTDVRPVATIDNGVGVDNEEQGQRVWLCAGQKLPWSRLWPRLKELS